MSPVKMFFCAKDFIETAQGLCFAVVQNGVERVGNAENVLCFLRYIKAESGTGSTWQKVGTERANAYLQQFYPQYLYYSEVSDTVLHGVEVGEIVKHYKPAAQLQQILASPIYDPVEDDVRALCTLYDRHGLDVSRIGVTGSLLLGAQHPASDIDLVFYDRALFQQARSVTAALIESGQLTPLDDIAWLESYRRRSCELSLADYVRHERRKNNKALINGRKFDLNLVVQTADISDRTYKKCGMAVIRAKIADAAYGFDYPAVYAIDHPDIPVAVCFIATYTGQAVDGETVEIAGRVEQADDGGKRIVVGSSREAPGEYMKVISCLD